MNYPYPADVFARFLSIPVEEYLAETQRLTDASHLLDLFHRTVARVPAYREFLGTKGILPEFVRSYADFCLLPMMTKDDYVRAYPLVQRCRDAKITNADTVAVSSGSTGLPTIWPRNVEDELGVAYEFERILKWSFAAHQRSTLAVICFALGTWVGGFYTTAVCRYLAQKGFALTVVTPGNNVAEILRILPELAPEFDQVVLFGYPPFLKTVVDAGITANIRWAEFNTKMVFAGEVISEAWRKLMTVRVEGTDVLHTTASMYGTADAGVIGAETPLSIAIRRFLADHGETAKLIFGESRLPTLVQYNPNSRFLETNGDTLVVTCDGVVPLIRYHIADKGGVIAFDAMMKVLRDAGCDPTTHFKLALNTSNVALPFAYVFGRADFTVSYFGANVFPENIAVGLEQDEFENALTGKFVLEVGTTSDGNAELQLTVELTLNSEPYPGLATEISESVRTHVCRINSEFANYVPAERQYPTVNLRPFGDPEWFPIGVKHRYTRK